MAVPYNADEMVHEADAVFSETKGPIDSFIVNNEQALISQAILTGDLPRGVFRDVAAFTNEPAALEQKRMRYEAKRAQEIEAIMLNNEERGELSLEDRAALLHAQQVLNRAVVVEAARKLTLERADGSIKPASEALYRTTLERAQDDLFPKPDPQVAAYAARLVMNGIRQADIAQYDELLEKYPFMENIESGAEADLISPEKRQAWHDYLHQMYDPVFNGVREKMGNTELLNVTIPQAVSLFMRELGFPMKSETEDGWEVVSDDKVVGFKVIPEKRQVVCGVRKAEITWPIFEQLMLHEIGIHATRAENGYKRGIPALQTGLPGYQEIEEGLGILLEKLWSGKPLDTVGRDHYRYLATYYACGAFDGTPHDEAETLAFITDVAAAKKPGLLHDDETIVSSRRAMIDHVKRPFRGMPEGEYMYSNLAYLSGSREAARLLQNSPASPAAMLTYLQQGKFNPLINEHDEFVEPLAA